MDLVGDLLKTLDQMVNNQFESSEFKKFFAVPLTLEKGRFYVVQSALYTNNRRDCWGYVQGSAPLAVKRVIWEHESDELINDPRAGMDHYSLTVKQGEVIGLKPEDFENAEVPAMVRACFYAWHHVALRSHWLTAYTASHMLERRNNGKIIQGGGMSYRVGKKFENELGINLKKMISIDVHVVADTEHSENISEMFERYVKTPEDRDLVLQGARDSMRYLQQPPNVAERSYELLANSLSNNGEITDQEWDILTEKKKPVEEVRDFSLLREVQRELKLK